MTIVHIVLFKPNPSLTKNQVKELYNDMTNLKNTCIHPTTKQPYITSFKGGKDNSPEGKQGGFEYGFVVEFESTQDRDYYLNDDPSHQAFVAKIKKGLVDDARVLDFEPGVAE
ncbi:MAG: hypothetical protein Q9160_004805 [Pyrenula sp. 1 TL-2023]